MGLAPAATAAQVEDRLVRVEQAAPPPREMPERVLIEMDVSRRKRAERIDSAAASFILQGALDRLTSLERDALSD